MSSIPIACFNDKFFAAFKCYGRTDSLTRYVDKALLRSKLEFS